MIKLNLFRFCDYMKQHNTFGTGDNYMSNFELSLIVLICLAYPIYVIFDLV